MGWTMYFSIKKYILCISCAKLGYNIKCISYVFFESWDEDFSGKVTANDGVVSHLDICVKM